MRPFRSFVVYCEDPDAVDDVRFDIVSASRKAVVMNVEGGIEMTFDARAFDDGRGLLAMSQSNDVTHEDDPALRTFDGRSKRTIRLVDTTPPFILPRALLRDGDVIRGLRFWDFLGPMPDLPRAGDEQVEIIVRGVPKKVRAERYGARSDELVLVRDWEGLDGSALVLRAQRDDEFAVTLRAME